MSDIKFTVTVDTAGGIVNIQNLEKAIDTSGKTAEGAHGPFDKLFQGVAAGIISADLLGKGFSKTTGFLRDTIGAAADAEKANQGLDAALFTTGRTTAQLGDHFKAYADQLMRSTVYDDEAIKGAQDLLLQLTSLDKDGIDRATKGAIGLATVFRMDLGSASELVARWMEGNTDRIKKYGIHVDETASKEKQQAQILEQLGIYYQRAELATGTFSGILAQLKNVFVEAQEKIGTAVTQNESFRKTVKAIKDEIQLFIDSGQAEKWGERLSRVLDLAILGAKGFFKMLKEGPMGMGDVLAEQIINPMEGVHAETIKNVKTITEFRDGLKWIKPTVAEMKEEIEKGAASWGEYRYRIAQANAEFEKNKKTLGGWMDQAFGVIGINTEIAKSFDKSSGGAKGLGDELAKGSIRKMGFDLKEMAFISEELNADVGKVLLTMAQLGQPTTKPLSLAWKGWFLETKKQLEELEKIAKEASDRIPYDFAEAALKYQQEVADAVNHIQSTMGGVSNVITGLGNLSQAKEEARLQNLNAYYDTAERNLNNYYAAEEKKIEDSGLSEEQKRAKILALEKEKQTKISLLENEADQKRKEMQREAAKTAKEVAKLTTVINTASGIMGALTAIPWGPWNWIQAGLVGIQGAVELAVINAQPLPLATGGVFTQPTRFMTERGGYYKAEQGEMMIPPGKAGGGVTHIHNHIYVGGHEIREEIIKIVNQAAGRNRLVIPAKVIS